MNAKNSLHLQINSYLTVGLLTLGTLALGAITPQLAQAANVTGGKTTANSYVTNVPGNGGYAITPLLTVGDEVQLLDGDLRTGLNPVAGQTFAMSGIPDGLGFFETEDANYVFMNHELSATTPGRTGEPGMPDVLPQPVLTPISSTTDGVIQGARVSVFQFDKNWNAIGGMNLIETAVDGNGTTYELNTTTGAYEAISSDAVLSFNRFCSSYLAQNGFVDQDGNPAPIYFGPEEGGVTSRGWSITPDGTAQSLDGLGLYAKENIVAASQYRADNSDRTVLLSTEDFTDGELYMFVGEQTDSDPNGFEQGALYVLKVDGADFETLAEDVETNANWTLVDDEAAIQDGVILSSYVNAPGRSTNFRRLEDIAEDPNNPGSFYFATTGTENLPGTDPTMPLTPDAETAEAAENPYGKLYRFSLNPDDPTGTISNFELVLNGGFGTGVSYDNIVVDSNGNVLIQEDETAFGGDVLLAEERDSRVWSYNIASGQVTSLFETDQTAANVEFERGAWETSGIIEIDPNALPGRSSYLFDVQASTIEDPRYVRGGQLILTTPVPEPGTTTALSLFGLTALGLKLKRQRRGA